MGRRNDQTSRPAAYALRRITRGEALCAVDGAGGQFTSSGATQIGLEIGPHRRVCVLLALLEGPLLFGSIDATEIADARVHLRCLTRVNKIRNGDRCQKSDDGHYNHDFNQGEPDSMDEFTLHNDLFFKARCEQS